MQLAALYAELRREMPQAEHEARWLLAHFLAIPKSELPLRREQEVPPEVEAEIRAAVARRLAGEPLQYITGLQPFWDFELIVTPDVLIPRWDSEAVLEQTLTLLPRGKAAKVCDMCTGSGAYALVLQSERPEITVAACDCSEAALAVARRNAAKYGLTIDFRCGDLFGALQEGEKFDLIVSNPPYVKDGEILPADVRREPALALFGGADGLDFYRRLVKEAGQYLSPGGFLLLEIGAEQKDAVCGLLRRQGFSQMTAGRDLAGRDRWVQGQWEGA